jgi:hypothetical protein
LRRAALAWRQARTGPRSAGDALWHGLFAGRWRLLDAFMADGARYMVACRNPEPTASLCALVPRERIVLELALAGHSVSKRPSS